MLFIHNVSSEELHQSRNEKMWFNSRPLCRTLCGSSTTHPPESGVVYQINFPGSSLSILFPFKIISHDPFSISCPQVNKFGGVKILTGLFINYPNHMLSLRDISKIDLWVGRNSNIFCPLIEPFIKLSQDTTSVTYIIVHVPETWMKCTQHFSFIYIFFNCITNSNRFPLFKYPPKKLFFAIELSFNEKSWIL